MIKRGVSSNKAVHQENPLDKLITLRLCTVASNVVLKKPSQIDILLTIVCRGSGIVVHSCNKAVHQGNPFDKFERQLITLRLCMVACNVVLKKLDRNISHFILCVSFSFLHFSGLVSVI